MKIAVVGCGYVGLSNAVVLAQHHEVWAVDVDAHKVEQINQRVSPIADADLQSYLASMDLHLQATVDARAAFQGADFIVVATPTDYDTATNRFDTSTVESTIETALAAEPSAAIVIKSTVPVGFTARMRDRHEGAVIIFSPEFLREGRALHDNLHPSRIVIGSDAPEGKIFASLLVEGALDKTTPVVFTGATEAEAIKLFANTYLALRVAYFNELDTYAATHGLATARIIEGVGLDPRIGMHYNNPSFGYGGYCLPKDTKQLRANYDQVPQNLIEAIVEANATRKDFIANEILKAAPAVVGIHRLAMKEGADNFRMSSVLGVMKRLKAKGITILVYEPALEEESYFGSEVLRDLDEFKSRSDLIVANRMSSDLEDVAGKVYTRDIYGTD